MFKFYLVRKLLLSPMIDSDGRVYHRPEGSYTCDLPLYTHAKINLLAHYVRTIDSRGSVSKCQIAFE
jgi:hypothetical protein